MTDQLTPEQRAASTVTPGENRGWGLEMSVVVGRDGPAASPGRYGWDGGYETSWQGDPKEGLIGILLTQVVWAPASGPPVYHDFWTSTYHALDD